MTEATKVFLAHVAQFGREVGFGAVHGGNLTIGVIRPIGRILTNKRLKAIMQPDYSRQFKLWRPFSDIKTTNQFQVVSDLSWPETLAL